MPCIGVVGISFVYRRINEMRSCHTSGQDDGIERGDRTIARLGQTGGAGLSQDSGGKLL
jgi:hypothetical protein